MVSRHSQKEESLFFSRTYDYLEHYLPLQINYSKHTVESYRDALSVFRRFITKEYNLSVKTMKFGHCTRDLMLAFMEYLQKNGCKAGTCNQRLSAIKSYLWYASDQDVAIQSIAISISHIPPVKGSERIKEKLSEEALRTILLQPNTAKKKGIRDQSMLVLLYDSGVRLSELVDLSVEDVILDSEPRIYVLGKGSKERVVAITDATAEHLKLYISIFHKSASEVKMPLYYTKIKGEIRKMSASNIQRIVQHYADEARKVCPSVPLNVYPHMFRRTRATDLYQNGVALELVSRVLGHSSVTTTKIYAKPSLSMLRDIMESAMPTCLDEAPSWVGNEEEMIRLCGLR